MAEGHADQRGDGGLAVYDLTSAAEAPRQALAVLEYGLLGCALFALIGSAVMYATER